MAAMSSTLSTRECFDTRHEHYIEENCWSLCGLYEWTWDRKGGKTEHEESVVRYMGRNGGYQCVSVSQRSTMVW